MKRASTLSRISASSATDSLDSSARASSNYTALTEDHEAPLSPPKNSRAWPLPDHPLPRHLGQPEETPPKKTSPARAPGAGGLRRGDATKRKKWLLDEYCSGCRAMHPAYDFSPAQLALPPNDRVCIGREGHFQLCKHKKVTYADIERAVQQNLSGSSTSSVLDKRDEKQHEQLQQEQKKKSSNKMDPRVILQCKDPSHMKASMLPSRRKGPRYEVMDYVRPHMIGWRDKRMLRMATYWEELVCHVPFNQPLTAQLLQEKLDALAATSNNVLCRHLALNDAQLARLARGVDCASLYAVDAGVHDLFVPLNSSLHCAEARDVMAAENIMGAAGPKARAVRGDEAAGSAGYGANNKKCTMMDSRDQCGRCFSTSFGLRRWRGGVGVAVHEIWLYGQSYLSFPEGMRPSCEIWRQRIGMGELADATSADR